ncbi:MAG: hypothetical protein JAZ17_27700 [Candidatus Thiodiazotropha endolucinida]|nr:hypothetical protein [Candidatus Thiodiazotropha taylori]MCG7953557.1 hypothetical protein [Candidatus Thiodiazotropha taylori]MCG8097357.1 hypothetical protein [Candidatus Thiodiazotropha endolucinida]MCW4268983.1 hypothetical protein [Candidatus Thiodiazotropha endolucinida]MCW4270793.1 hypothetical protein [Candidatus Thiodiazotropha endolucinida]
MSNTSNEPSTESYFGKVISTYTRAQAIEDGVLIDAGAMASEAGFKWPVALTTAAWADCVAWTEEDSRQQVYQDETGRLWDVIYMASHAIRTSKDSGDRLLFQLYRVPRDGKSLEAELVTLRLIVGPGDAGEPVVTILQQHED